ncbi:stage II sporulation protein M [Candidatus Woesearchaeota archaeon]|nr:stage II sporulation protein M [Candidatus Woesearchaeota archaeon]
MVLESLIFPLKAEKRPWEMFFIGFLYSTVGVFLSLWIFEKQASFIMVFLTVMACVPIMYNTMKLEESKEVKIKDEGKLLREHTKAITFYMFLFFGIAISTVVWYVFLPPDTVSFLFQKQIQTITDINNQISGGLTGSIALFIKILFNNVKVMVFCLIFSFIYGAGAIFILTWNATVIGAAMGSFIRSHLSSYAATIGVTKIASYFQAVSLGLLRYSIHGIPEILGYVYAGLVGGLVSVAIIKHDINSKNLMNLLVDTSDLLLLSLAFLLLGAVLEVYVTPLLF